MQKREIKAVLSSEMWQQTVVHKLLALSGSVRARCRANAARPKPNECLLRCIAVGVMRTPSLLSLHWWSFFAGARLALPDQPLQNYMESCAALPAASCLQVQDSPGLEKYIGAYRAPGGGDWATTKFSDAADMGQDDTHVGTQVRRRITLLGTVKIHQSPAWRFDCGLR